MFWDVQTQSRQIFSDGRSRPLTEPRNSGSARRSAAHAISCAFIKHVCAPFLLMRYAGRVSGYVL